MENREVNRFTYADLYADCYRYLGINDPTLIKRLTLSEYKALRKGSLLKSIDDMELLYTHAYKTALAGGFDKDGKPLIKSFKDLFDRPKVEKALLADSGDSRERRVRKEDVEAFRRSKERAEAIMNGISFGEEDDNDS